MTELASLAPVLPEILVICAAMALLMFGVFRPETGGNAALAGWAAVIVLGAAGVLILQQSGRDTLFESSFVVDVFARFMKIVMLVGAAGALVLAFDDFEARGQFKFEYPVLILLATAGMMMMISASDLISLYLGLELQSLALYVVAAFRRDDVRSSEAGLKYFVLGALSSGMLLYGASLIYGFAGSTSFAAIAAASNGASAAQNLLLIFGLVFLLVGIAFKVSAVPFHMWTPDVYQGAPTPVTAFFSVAPKAAAMALLVRVAFSAFPGIKPQWQQIMVFLSVASMVLGAFAAIGQTNIKRLMAYSSIANVGYALIGLAAGTPEGAQGVIIYMAIYVIMTLGTFACILSMRGPDGPLEEIEALAGLAQTNLPMAFAMAVFMFSLAGIPPLAGFWAKFYVFLPAITAGFYTLAVIGVVASVVGAYYYLRIVKIMFFDAPAQKFLAPPAKESAIMVIAAVLVLFYVVWPAPLVDAAAAAAKSLF